MKNEYKEKSWVHHSKNASDDKRKILKQPEKKEITFKRDQLNWQKKQEKWNNIFKALEDNNW